ncbi:MBL fold metallo-hydrolase [Limibacter armeniacum]|uniref:MBL fold metallo-hydrolase n=1 Tax=Limibacter armeniacum TaxID=466084 RepID=UPI002FE65282
MKVTFLGTGTSQGVPTLTCNCDVCRSIDFRDKRLRTSLHIMTDDGLSVVLDTGPDFRQQMLREKIRHLDAVVFTHQHKDHTAGLDDIRGYYFAQELQPIPVYCTLPVLEQLKLEYNYFFAEEKYPGVPSVDIHMIDRDTNFNIGDTTFNPIEVLHGKMRVLGFRIGNFTYITDANKIEPDQMDKIRGTEILVLNALHHEKHYSHFTLEEALEIVAEIQPKQAYFTHISHSLGLHKDVEESLPDGVHLAYDGLQITI